MDPNNIMLLTVAMAVAMIPVIPSHNNPGGSMTFISSNKAKSDFEPKTILNAINPKITGGMRNKTFTTAAQIKTLLTSFSVDEMKHKSSAMLPYLTGSTGISKIIAPKKNSSPPNANGLKYLAGSKEIIFIPLITLINRPAEK